MLFITFALYSQLVLSSLAEEEITRCPTFKKLLKSAENNLEDYRIGAKFLYSRNPALLDQLKNEEAILQKLGFKNPKDADNKVLIWLLGLERTHLGHPEDEQVLKRLREFYYEKHVIKFEDIPEAYYELQLKIMREQGIKQTELTNDMRKKLAAVLIEDQKASLDHWINYFLSKQTAHYPIWAKVWAFESMTKLGAFLPETGTFAKRSKGLVAPFPDLNREALALVMDAVIKVAKKEPLNSEIAKDKEFYLLAQKAKFQDIYTYTLNFVSKNSADLNEVRGQWVKYPQGSNPDDLVKSLYCQNTGWCTAGPATAKAHLSAGDFYIYMSLDKQGNPTKPRMAIRMEGDNIAEVRGIAKGQNLDPVISQTDILDKKLSEFGEKGDSYKKKSRHMALVTAIDKKVKAKSELTKEELRFIYQLEEKIEGFGYGADPRIKEILTGRNAKKDLSIALGIRENQISTSAQEATTGGVLFHYGDLDLSEVSKIQKKQNGLTKQIISSVTKKVFGQSIHKINLPKKVSGNVTLYSESDLLNTELPEWVGGSLDFGRTNKLPPKTKIPKYIGGELKMSYLETSENLIFPIDFKIEGGINLSRLKSIKGVKWPKVINGDIDLSSLESASDFILPETVKGALNLRNLKKANGITFPKNIESGLNLSSLKSPDGLILPDTIGGTLDLSSLTNATGVKFPKTIGKHLYLSGLKSAEGLVLPEKILGDLDLIGLRSAKGLVLPNHIEGVLDLSGLNSLEGLVIPPTIDKSKIIFPKKR